MRVYNCARDHKMRLMQLFPLGLHSHGMTATHLFEREVLQGCRKKKNVQGDSFWTTEDAVAHWPRLDVCRPRLARNLNSRSCFARDSLAGRFAGPASGRKGWSPGLCCSTGGEAALTRKIMFSFYRCHHVVVCSLTSIQEARGKRSNHLLVGLSAIAEDKTKAIKTQFRNCT